MAKKALRKTLPKEFDDALAKAATDGEYSAVHAMLQTCIADARSGYAHRTALMRSECTPELARWLVANGADVNAVDDYGDTALHGSVFARYHHKLPPAVLVELGADIHRANKNGRTPLHAAVDGKNLASVELLLAHGAQLDALSNNDLTPLEYGLQRMSNIDLVAMEPVARLLLAKGARVTRAPGFVDAAAKTFEFHRAGFAKDSVEATAAACAALCAMFNVAAPAQRRMHDGVSPIVALATTWQKRHAELWDFLVPSSGACATVQGEVIRIAGRVGDELHRNGGINWDSNHDAMLDAFCAWVATAHSLTAEQLADCRRAAARGKNMGDADRRLAELAVLWVELNPTPIVLPPPTYQR